jgi:hypothetical protein
VRNNPRAQLKKELKIAGFSESGLTPEEQIAFNEFLDKAEGRLLRENRNLRIWEGDPAGQAELARNIIELEIDSLKGILYYARQQKEVATQQEAEQALLDTVTSSTGAKEALAQQLYDEGHDKNAFLTKDFDKLSQIFADLIKQYVEAGATVAEATKAAYGNLDESISGAHQRAIFDKIINVDFSREWTPFGAQTPGRPLPDLTDHPQGEVATVLDKIYGKPLTEMEAASVFNQGQVPESEPGLPGEYPGFFDTQTSEINPAFSPFIENLTGKRPGQPTKQPGGIPVPPGWEGPPPMTFGEWAATGGSDLVGSSYGLAQNMEGFWGESGEDLGILEFLNPMAGDDPHLLKFLLERTRGVLPEYDAFVATEQAKRNAALSLRLGGERDPETGELIGGLRDAEGNPLRGEAALASAAGIRQETQAGWRANPTTVLDFLGPKVAGFQKEYALSPLGIQNRKIMEQRTQEEEESERGRQLSRPRRATFVRA